MKINILYNIRNAAADRCEIRWNTKILTEIALEPEAKIAQTGIPARF